MILGQAQPIRHDKTSTRFSKPARPLKDGRRSDFRMRDTRAISAKYCLTTCPREHDFTSTRTLVQDDIDHTGSNIHSE